MSILHRLNFINDVLACLFVPILPVFCPLGEKGAEADALKNNGWSLLIQSILPRRRWPHGLSLTVHQNGLKPVAYVHLDAPGDLRCSSGLTLSMEMPEGDHGENRSTNDQEVEQGWTMDMGWAHPGLIKIIKKLINWMVCFNIPCQLVLIGNWPNY